MKPKYYLDRKGHDLFWEVPSIPSDQILLL